MKSNKIGGIGYFNAARGLGMLYVLLGHSAALYWNSVYDGAGAGAGRVISSGVMVMFFMISGYGFFKRKPQKCVRIQLKLLVKPYAMTAVAIWISKLLLSWFKGRPYMENGGELIITYLLGLNAINGGQIGKFAFNSISILWFLLALCGGWIIYNGILQLQSRKWQKICIFGCIVLSVVFSHISEIWPFCLPMVFLAVGYLAAGDQMRKRKWLEQCLPWWGYGILVIITIPSILWGDIDILGCKWKLGIIDVISSFILGFLFMKVYVFCMKKIQGGWLLDKIESIGMHSLWIMCIHGYEKVMIPWYRLEMYFPSGISTVICCIGRGIVIWVLFQCIQWIQNRSRRSV